MSEATTRPRPPRIRRRGRPPQILSYTVDRHGDVIDFDTDFDELGAASVAPSSLAVRSRSRLLAGGGW